MKQFCSSEGIVLLRRAVTEAKPTESAFQNKCQAAFYCAQLFSVAIQLLNSLPVSASGFYELKNIFFLIFGQLS